MAWRFIAPNRMRAGRLVRPARLSLCAAALAAATASFPAPAAEPSISAAALALPFGGQSIADFYDARGGRPLWLQDDGGAQATVLLDLLRTADADGLDPDRYRIDRLEGALRSAWGGAPAEVLRADRLLSEAFVAYVRDLKRPPQVSMVWVDPELKPKPPTARQLLEAAAEAPDLESWLAEMRFMHPIYAGIRNAIAHGETSGTEARLLRLNLERARVLPATGRYIVVNATGQRLTAYEDGEIVDSMRVVVGKPKNPTPMMAAYIRFASLNPYWYVPPDLAAERIAPNVLKQGLGYLRTQGYQVMSNWTDDASVIDPETIDWQAVADGTRQVYIRQQPGPANAMGKMKFMFPNAQGVYLHDTPQKELLTEASRMFSGGCVRLEDAPRLARWMFGEPLQASSKAAELRVDLPKPVPVFITYLTVMPEGSGLAVLPDVYGRDRDELAMSGSQVLAGR
jgi:murein L,D-transpeptidase YcbB/YkuD